MISIQLNEEDLKNIRTFLSRTELRGYEVDAFNKVVQRIESPMPPQKTPGEIIDGMKTKKLVEKILDREDLKEELEPIINRYRSYFESI